MPEQVEATAAARGRESAQPFLHLNYSPLVDLDTSSKPRPYYLEIASKFLSVKEYPYSTIP